ncbi:MAG: glycosyltransferase family 39 protein [Anaerolineae bacterium]
MCKRSVPGKAQTPTQLALWLAAILLAAGLRLVGLNRQPLWWDEGWSVYFASLPVGDMLSATAQDIHPPLYYALLHYWCQIFGYSPSALRLLSVVFGVGLVAAVYALATAILDHRIGLLAAVLTAIAPMQVFYAQEVRMYGLVTLLGTISWYALLQSKRQRNRPASWQATYVLATSLALYTEYYAAILWLGQCLYMIASSGRYPADTHNIGPCSRWCSSETMLIRGYATYSCLMRFLKEHAFLFLPPLLYLPWLAYVTPKLLTYVGQKRVIEGYQALDPFSFAWAHLSSFAAGHRVGQEHPALLLTMSAIAFLCVAALGLATVPKSSALLRVSLSYLFLPLVAGYAINVLFPFTPPFFERVLLLASPPLYLATAAAILRLTKRVNLKKGAVLGLLLGLAPAANLYYVWTVPRYPGRDYRPLFQTIRRLGSREDRILCVHPWQYGYAIAYLPERLRNLYLVPTDEWQDSSRRRDDLYMLLGNTARLWFPAHQSLGRILEDEILADLDSLGYRGLAEWYGNETFLVAYATAGEPLSTGTMASFEEGPTLIASEFSSQAVSGAGAITVRLHWQGIGPDSNSFQASLRLLDGHGTTWASHDFPIESAEQNAALLIPWGTPATRLELALILTRNGVELHPSSLNPERFTLPLGSVEILPAVEPPPTGAELGLRYLGARFQSGPILWAQQSLPKQVQQGEILPVELWWQAEQQLASECVIFLQALTDQGVLVAAAEERATGGIWPMTQWQDGALVRDPHQLLMPAHAPIGHLRVIVGLLDPKTRARVPVSEHDYVLLGEVDVTEARRSFVPPAAESSIAIAFSDLATLIGYTIEPCQWQSSGACLANEDTLNIQLVWQANSETSRRYRSFVHLLAGDTIVAQSVHEPRGAPTTAWLPGQYIDDSHTLDVTPIKGSDGLLLLAVGLYDPETGARLTPVGGEIRDGRLGLVTVARP